jgi:hypothetical protein
MNAYRITTQQDPEQHDRDPLIMRQHPGVRNDERVNDGDLPYAIIGEFMS